MIPLQILGDSFGLGNLVIAIAVPVLIVAFGTYVGVLMALQSFFGTDSWSDALVSDGD